MKHEKSKTWKKCATKKTWKVKEIANNEECNTEKVQHEESATLKECNKKSST